MLSYVRAKLARVSEPADPGITPAERLWDEIYGRSVIHAESLDDLAKQATDLIEAKNVAAAAVISLLLVRIAKTEGLPLFEVLDQTAEQLARSFDDDA